MILKSIIGVTESIVFCSSRYTREKIVKRLCYVFALTYTVPSAVRWRGEGRGAEGREDQSRGEEEVLSNPP